MTNKYKLLLFLNALNIATAQTTEHGTNTEEPILMWYPIPIKLSDIKSQFNGTMDLNKARALPSSFALHFYGLKDSLVKSAPSLQELCKHTKSSQALPTTLSPDHSGSNINTISSSTPSMLRNNSEAQPTFTENYESNEPKARISDEKPGEARSKNVEGATAPSDYLNSMENNGHYDETTSIYVHATESSNKDDTTASTDLDSTTENLSSYQSPEGEEIPSENASTQPNSETNIIISTQIPLVNRNNYTSKPSDSSDTIGIRIFDENLTTQPVQNTDEYKSSDPTDKTTYTETEFVTPQSSDTSDLTTIQTITPHNTEVQSSTGKQNSNEEGTPNYLNEENTTPIAQEIPSINEYLYTETTQTETSTNRSKANISSELNLEANTNSVGTANTITEPSKFDLTLKTAEHPKGTVKVPATSVTERYPFPTSTYTYNIKYGQSEPILLPRLGDYSNETTENLMANKSKNDKVAVTENIKDININDDTPFYRFNPNCTAGGISNLYNVREPNVLSNKPGYTALNSLINEYLKAQNVTKLEDVPHAEHTGACKCLHLLSEILLRDFLQRSSSPKTSLKNEIDGNQ